MPNDEKTPLHNANPRQRVEDRLFRFEVYISDALNENNVYILDAKDRADLEYAQITLRRAFDELVEWFMEPVEKSRPKLFNHGFDVILALMECCQIVGSRTALNIGIEKYLRPNIEKEAFHARAWTASFVKQLNDASRLIPLDDAIREEMDELRPKFRPAKSLKYAQQLRPGVLRRLEQFDFIDIDASWPSASTIKVRVKKLLEPKEEDEEDMT